MKLAAFPLALALLAAPALSQGDAPGDPVLIPVKQDGAWGLANLAGELVLSPQYERLRARRDGLFETSRDDRVTLLDANGNVLLETDYSYIGEFDERGIAFAQQGTQSLYIDELGRPVLGPGFQSIIPFDDDGNFAVRYANLWGVVSLDCDWSFAPFLYSLGDLADNGLAAADLGREQSGYVNANGEWVIPAGTFQRTGDFAADGLAPAMVGGKWGFIDESGDWVVQPISDNRFLAPQPFGPDGLTAVIIDGLYGLINRSGEVVVEPTFQSLVRRSHGLFRAQRDDMYGLIDGQGNEVVPLVNERMTFFGDAGLVRAMRGGEWLIIDREGNDVFGDRFEMVGTFEDRPYAAAREGGRWGLIDTRGEWLFAPQFDCVIYCYDDTTPPPSIVTRRGPPIPTEVPQAFLDNPLAQEWCHAPPRD